jgi:hypothetical protein
MPGEGGDASNQQQRAVINRQQRSEQYVQQIHA